MRSVARNLALLALALFALTAGGGDPGTSPFSLFDDLSGTEVVLLLGLLLALVGIAVEGWLITHLLGQNGRLLLRMDALEKAPGFEAQAPDMADGLNIGTPLPAVTLTSLDGQPAQLTDLIERSRSTLVVVSDPNCGPCKTLRPEIAAWQRDHGQRLNVVLISRGDPAINRSHAEEHGISSVYLERDRAASKALDVTGTPSAVLISRDGAIASEVAAGAVAIRALVARSTERPQIPLSGTRRAPAPSIGTPAASVSLPDLDDQQRSLNEWAGKKRVLLFWNPGCGFCRRLAPEIQEWVQNRQPDAPELILISTGSASDNRSLGIDASTLLESSFGTGRSFGASGTPSAIAIDEEGRIASALAVGGPDVMRLLGADRPSSGQPAASSNGAASASQPAPTTL